MGLVDLFRQLAAPEERSGYPLSFNEWIMQYQNSFYAVGGGFHQTLTGTTEPIDTEFAGLVQGAYKQNGVVFACELVRISLFSEARFQFQAMKGGRPGDLYGTTALSPLETPWPNATTGDLLTRALQDADFAGNSFIVRRGENLKRLRPDWVTMVLSGENGDPDTELIGIVFEPGGPGSGRDPMTFTREEIAHFAPNPDPIASFRGMSWITPVIREIQADNAGTQHKESSFTNGATPNMIVKLDVNNVEKFEAMKKAFRDNHEGVANAYKTLFLAGGADATVVGQNFQQMDFKALQGSAETRIAAAAGVHPAIVGLSEGLQGSSLNAGNFTAAARLTGDKTLRPLWRNFCGSIANLITVPGGSRLWYDTRDIAFLQADIKDAAEVQQVQAQSIKALIDSGFEPDSITAAVTSEDWSKLVHTGLYSVQLQPPMPEGPPTTAITVGQPTPAPDNQLAFASIIASAIRDKRPDVIRVEPQVQPTPVDVHVDAPNIEVAAPEVHVDAAPMPNVEFNAPDIHVAAPNVNVERSDVTVEPPEVNVTTPEVTVELETVAKMIGEIEARRIIAEEKAEERQRQLFEDLKPPPPVKMTRRIERDENGLLVRIIEEPEEETG